MTEESLPPEQSDILVQSLHWSHGALDVETLHVLPVLLQQRHQEVHGQMDVLDQLLLGHVHVAHGDTETQHLLHLELDGGLQVQSLLLQVVVVGDQGGELASLERVQLFFISTNIFPILTLLRPGPRSLGICLIRVSEARKAS